MQNSLTAALVITPPAMVLIINPLMLYLSMGSLMLTCLMVCGHIILRCRKRESRLDAVMTRAIRRENAKLAEREGHCGK